MTKEIRLNQGFVALVDDEDYERLSQWKWYVNCNRYAIRYDGRENGKNRPGVWMHHAIIGRQPGLQIDHINGNGLDNRRSNLRFATPQQNAYNARKRRNASSQYRGVAWQKEMKVWIARVSVDGKQVQIGKFDNEIDAARAFDAAARQYHGEFARLNFPEVQA